MTRLAILFIGFLSLIANTFAQIPAYGNDTLMDVGTWNLEWFGSTEGGPNNETLQFNNVKKVLSNTDIDAWGFTEMSNPSTFQQLLIDLPQYSGVSATFAQTQKTAFIYKNELFDLVDYKHLLTASNFNYNFAGRRPLEVTLATKAPLIPDTISFIVIHLKAFGDEESYTRRKNAAAALKIYYLNANTANRKFIILGDWNDDLDQSIYNGIETPFKTYIDDSENYFFATKA